jgi:D-arabinose 1-dehydrogenase-like Zn-dependent alcohol dehydrogenase
MMIPMRALRITGIRVGSLPDLIECVEVCKKDSSIRSIVTKRRPFKEVDQALKDLQKGLIVGRSILVME